MFRELISGSGKRAAAQTQTDSGSLRRQHLSLGRVEKLDDKLVVSDFLWVRVEDGYPSFTAPPPPPFILSREWPE